MQDLGSLGDGKTAGLAFGLLEACRLRSQNRISKIESGQKGLLRA